MYDNGLKEYSYVCSHCFNPLNKCDCEQYPETLIQIDKRMVPIIKKLNDMFYKTEGCCEGHIGKFDKIYIFFVKNINSKFRILKDLRVTVHIFLLIYMVHQKMPRNVTSENFSIIYMIGLVN